MGANWNADGFGSVSTMKSFPLGSLMRDPHFVPRRESVWTIPDA